MSTAANTADALHARRNTIVARGVPNPKLVVARAQGASVVDVDGREFLDFVGGIGCQNLGHGNDAVVAAVHEQVDRFMHQQIGIGSYESYVEVCRKLNESVPISGPVKSMLVNSGAEAVENAVKIARAATGRPGILVFDRGFHGRTLLTMTMTAKLVYRKGFGPYAPEVYRAAAPYPYRGISSDDAIADIERRFKSDADPETIACAVLEPVQGEGGFVVIEPDFPGRLKELCERHGILYVDDEIQTGCGRTGTMWALEQYNVEPDLVVSGKTLGGGLPLAGVTGRAEVMDAPGPGGLGGTFGGNPVACAAASVVLDEVARPEVLAGARRLGERLRAGLDDLQTRIAEIGDVRGLGPMLAIELVLDRKTKAPATDLVGRTIASAFDKGLLLMSSGLYSNVIRFLPPLTLTDAELETGLALLERSLRDAGATAA
ncbi:MAG: aspartate aminotransferase family protein [Actinobacteria bacterium]|nr:aspartate aminotransferase family protein [Actinomycetota bacterium]